MTGKDIPAEDRITRYCKPSSVINGRLLPCAFAVRRREDYLSVNWIEYLGARDLDSAAAVAMVSELLRDKGYKVKSGGRVAIIGVGTAVSVAFDAANKRIRIRHVPRPDDESHSGVFGYAHDDTAIAAALSKHAQPFRTD